ncbi:hypothetical protein INT47_006568 [Mucor saturninus]|uniref:Response regulatory domain-containing protein n=1 Tax=Mucor saturninus TaxID=64648 RepID=A0A8H7V4F5_9FUNG|nr:hypothetical protein INT47_006568 [Mucor saturninus]
MADQASIKEDSTTKANASTKNIPKRPRLNYLHSAWTTNDLYYHDSGTYMPSSTSTTKTSPQENLYHFRLPPLQLQDVDQDEEECDEVLTELFRVITIANMLCLFGSLFATTLVLYTIPSFHLILRDPDWMPHAILPLYVLWWLFMLLVLKHRTTEHLSQYLNWTQLSTLTMAFTHSVMPIRHPSFRYYHLCLVSLSLSALFTFAFTARLVKANEIKLDRFKRRMKREEIKLQQCVDTHTTEFTDHRLAFISTVSQEIQDVALMVITTLEQFSPANILANHTHELLSACSIAVPIASISAINTTIRQVCHVSSHLELLSKLTIQAWTRSNIHLLQLPTLVSAEFDIGELLQSLGDALAGVAAKLGVDFVIYHCDNRLHHTVVIGDEGAIRHALLNHIRNILECCTRGASIEVGLNVNEIRDPDKLNILFYITHTSSPDIRDASAALLPNANLTSQLLTYIGGSCAIDTETENQTRFEFSFQLGLGKRELPTIKHGPSLLQNHYANIKFSNEPSLKELHKFIENLKGLKMVLHAPEQSIFAKHMTSCLASWNTDISHVPVTVHESTPAEEEEVAFTAAIPTTPPVPSPAIEEEHLHSIPPSFILIDDDIPTLESKLGEFRTQPPASANVLQQAHQGRRNHYNKKNFFHQGTTAIIHFTSLNNYKAVRDTIAAYAFLPSGRDPFSMPRVVVVPKPAGPRRFLTALHTAWNNSVVEPHFSAIATSPSSPMPPILSMLVQREIAAAASTAAASSNVTSPQQDLLTRISPGNETSPGGSNSRRRPVSGIFSPPIDNYFSSQQPTRRRSSNHVDLIDPELPLPPRISPCLPDIIRADPITAALDEPPVTVVTDPIVSSEPPKKKSSFGGQPMMNIRSHKKKRKDRGVPFADVVSPPIHVLIVEDNIINQAILSAWMKKHKIKFAVASNGLEAVNKWKTGGFHLVLMDIQLPVMNGIEATKKIRAIEKEQKIGVLPMSSSFLRQQQEVAAAVAAATAAAAAAAAVTATDTQTSTPPLEENTDQDDLSPSNVPSIFRSPVIIVALTASSLESDRHAALAAGCNDFLTKPVSLEWLEKKIIEWGCMQALIDFEGWRRWKRKSTHDDNSEIIKKKLASFTTHRTLQIDKQKNRGESESPTAAAAVTATATDKKQGVLLPGISHLVKQRRFSSSVAQTKLILKPSKSDSDVMPRALPSISNFHHKKLDIQSSTPQSGNKES